MDLSPGPRFRLVPFTPELISRPDILQEGTAVTLDGPGSVCDSALECLRDLGPVWGFHVQNAQAFDLQMLYRFSSLKYLGLGSKVRGLDCTRWAALEWLIAEWSPQLILPTAESRLRRIRIRALTSQDLSALPPWGRLELAEILSSSKLCSLTGSERWSSLRMIACLKLARLRDISALAKC